jgi:Asp-tRNA(Asn)/Glu-tRNA(Gln) amidotransferase A subunit family amidase
MRATHGPATVWSDIRGKGTAVGLMETLSAPGLNCDLFRCARAPSVTVAVDSVCDLSNLTAVEAVRRIANGDLRAEEYAMRLLERQRALRSLNALTWIDEARVLDAARAVDDKRRKGRSLGSLGGLPVIVKDNIDVAGTPTAAASASFKDNIRPKNAPVAQRLFDEGAVFFGKANMHELAGGGTCSNPSSGFVGNPYNPRRVPGGSSGGTAAAIAARIVPAGLGSDTAGSVRIPSAHCGTVGLRPSIFGGKLYSDEGVLPLAIDLDTLGPMARTVADVALLHSAITGQTVPAAPNLSGVRIGVPRSPFWEELDMEVARVAEDALLRLRAAGATLVDIDASVYYPLGSEVYATLVNHGLKEDLGPYLEMIESKLGIDDIVAAIASKDTRAMFERARGMTFTDAQLHDARNELRRKIEGAYRELLQSNGLAAILFPTQPMTAPLIRPGGDTATDEIEINGKKVSEGLIFIRNTRVTCALGVPGLSIPAGLTAQGLPVGLELDGLAGKDAELLALGMAVEQAWPRVAGPRGLG